MQIFKFIFVSKRIIYVNHRHNLLLFESSWTLSIVHAIYCKHISHFRICQSTNTTRTTTRRRRKVVLCVSYFFMLNCVYLMMVIISNVVNIQTNLYTWMTTRIGDASDSFQETITCVQNSFYIFNSKSLSVQIV